ncbi:MAG: hypothetical protein AAF714_01640 [Pseudomonadota bacterium]
MIAGDEVDALRFAFTSALAAVEAMTEAETVRPHLTLLVAEAETASTSAKRLDQHYSRVRATEVPTPPANDGAALAAAIRILDQIDQAIGPRCKTCGRAHGAWQEEPTATPSLRSG